MVRQNQLESKWCRENGVCNYETLGGRKTAILGAGEIGTETTKLLNALDVETVANLVRTPRENSPIHFTCIDKLLESHSKNLNYHIPTRPKSTYLLTYFCLDLYF